MTLSTTATDRSVDRSAASVASLDTAALASGLPLDEKIALLTGAGTWVLHNIDAIGLRTVTVSDGPIGVRGVDGDGRPSAQLPAPSATAATWDVDLQARIGTLMAGEARRKGVDVVLAPVVNLQRSPVGGRHFECLSEDPLLTTRLAVAFIDALQQQGVAACIKHFIANETETDRTEYVSRIDERTLREVYLAPFEAVVEAGVWTIMAAYNGLSLEGVDATATEHGPLLNGILKNEWGFGGVVISDWLATKNTVEAALGGLDLVMPGPGGPWGENLTQAVRDGSVPIEVIDDKVARILLLAERVGALTGTAGDVPAFDATDASPEPDAPEIRALLTELAARSTVVLRNEGALLPLGADTTSVALIGPNAAKLFTQGGGSAFVRAPLVADPVAALRAALPAASVSLHRGGVSEAGAPAMPSELLSTPDGAPGMLIEHLDSHGAVVDTSVITDAAHIWFDILDPRVVDVRLTTDVSVAGGGHHAIEFAPVGAHRIEVDGVLLSESGARVGSEVVLNSSYANPDTVTATLPDDDADRVVHIEAVLQVVQADAYGDFVRLHLRYREPGLSVEQEIAEAVAAASASDVAVVVIGTNPETESEGWDRPNLDLPGRQNELVRRVLEANPRTIVIVNAGAPVILPWLDEGPAALWWWLPGQEAGTSLAAVLTGAIEPSGRLPWTLPADEADVPVANGLPVDGFVDYPEGTDVGHRGWDRHGLTPAREFGYGLGYTTWEYSGIAVTDAPASGAEAAAGAATTLATASVTLANSGLRAGREVVQVYLEAPAEPADPQRPVRWLAGFAVVDAEPGVEITVDIPLARRSFEIWSTDAATWRLPAGTYRVVAGRSSRDLRLEAALAVS
ncbi:MAG: glycoside hydrolase family 3 C-terminal domain-containing protein [Leifsonia flava]